LRDFLAERYRPLVEACLRHAGGARDGSRPLAVKAR